MHHGKRLGHPHRRDTSLMTKVDGVWVRKLNAKENQAFKQSVQSPGPRYGQKLVLEESK